MFSLPAAVAAIIEDARRRQHRRRRGVAVIALGLAVIAGAGFFGSRQFGAHSHTAISATRTTSTGFTFVTEAGPNGLRIRRVMKMENGANRYGPYTVASSVGLRHAENEFVTVVLDPQTGAIEVRSVKRQGTTGALTLTSK